MFAAKHGKFWEMHDLIFKNYSSLSLERYKGFARQLGLDEEALAASISSQAFKAAIDKDMQDGLKASVTGTPSIFVNGRRVMNWRDLASFKKMIEDAMKTRTAAGAGG